MSEKRVNILRRALRRVFNRVGCAGLIFTVTILVTYSTLNFLIIQQAEQSPLVMIYGHMRTVDKQFTNRYYFAFSQNLVFDMMLDSKNAQEFELAYRQSDPVRVYAQKSILGRYVVKDVESPYLYLNSDLIEEHHQVSKYLYMVQVALGLLLMGVLLFEYISFYSKMRWFSNVPQR